MYMNADANPFHKVEEELRYRKSLPRPLSRAAPNNESRQDQHVIVSCVREETVEL